MGKQWTQWLTSFFWAPKSPQMVIAAMKLKDAFLPWKASYEQPRQHIKKQRHYFANKGPSSQRYGFSSSHIRMWQLDRKESWMLNNWCFELWCWRRLLRVPWTARRSNQSILKENSPECSLEELMLQLKLQYFGHLMQRADSFERPWCWERLKAGEGDDRGWDGWMASPTQWTWVWVNSGSWVDGQGGLACCGSWDRKESNMTEWLNWTELNWAMCWVLCINIAYVGLSRTLNLVHYYY